MVKKKRVLISVCVIAVLLIVMAVGIGIFVYNGRSDTDVQNVFDEMIAKKYMVMEDAEHVTAGGYDAVRLLWQVKEGTPLQIGIIYSMEYKKLYIYGDACMPEEIGNMSYQEYFEKCLKECGITWEEVEDRKEDFICKYILEQWFTGHRSRFSKDRLGELEVLDFLMPYEYCGKDNSKWVTAAETIEDGYMGTFQGKTMYTEWDAGNIRCRQTQRSRDYGYRDIMERVEADMNGFNTVSEYIKVEWYWRWDDDEEWREYDSVADNLDYIEFADWLREGGKIEGNLTKLAYTREEGEEKTREMIKECLESNLLFRNLEAAEYYIAGDELNIRLVYYDYEAKNPDWLENGKGEVWQGWITIKIDDIRRFWRVNRRYQ
ncbi:MAG: TipC family immunity protein [Eubacterium sp.]|nr:TipC family immunity protein [Eubacterium sp.]